MSLNKRRILIGKVVDAIGFHKGGNAISSAYNRILCQPAPFWLPGKSQTRLEIINALVGVVAKTNLWGSADEVEVYVLVGAARRSELVAEADI